MILKIEVKQLPKRNQGYFREQRLRNIKRRWNIIKQKGSSIEPFEPLDDPNFEPGTLAKGHNGYCGKAGTAVKTNTRKRHASYRHKGAYGPANNYSRHDKQQVEDRVQQIKEWENEDGKREKESFDCN